MNLYTTAIKAIDPRDGELKNWCGPHVPGISFADARDYCDNNGLGYCEVVGQLIAEIPTVPGKPYEADFGKMVDYENDN